MSKCGLQLTAYACNSLALCCNEARKMNEASILGYGGSNDRKTRVIRTDDGKDQGRKDQEHHVSGITACHP